MDGMYPDDLNKKLETPPKAPASSFAPERPPEDEILYLPPSQRPKPKWRKIFKIILIVLIVAVVVAVAYLKFFHNKKPSPSVSKTPTQTTQPIDAFADKTTEYTSENVGLTFAYPQGWKVNDTADKLTVTSPTTQLTDATGQLFKGKIVLTIQPKGTIPKAFDSGGVISALDSRKIKYTKPSPVQRGQTYLTFLQYTQELAKSELSGVYVTGDFGYQANQYVPKTDIAKLDPLISVTFQKCDNDACANPSDINIQTDMWTNNADFQKAIIATLTSIRVN